ncbi:matrixin family metalloprotease [Cohnella panacarvi]|uniref:matrixin family metalloprotease n=1 Tax=Cohnella panacarvi TaxID=400776 RepID=UPI00047E73AE|nr:matrixin family metalloprotease [Cohnella panacarvi]
MPTPLNGRKYATSSATFNNTGSQTARWTTAAGNWNSATNFKFTAGASTTFVANDVNDNTVTWDGITNTTWTTATGIITDNKCFLNTYYTSQTRYTQDIVNGIATHEFGHAIGLDHSTSNASVMFPYTFTVEGAAARPNVPGSDDIAAINSIYAASASSATTSSPSDNTTVSLHPSWAYHYGDINQLYKHADLAVIGVITHNHKPVKLGEHPFHHYSPSSLKVEVVLKGDDRLTNTEILLRQLGGEIGGVRVISDASTPLKKDQRFLLFLKKSVFGYYPINENEGIFNCFQPEHIFTNLASGQSFGKHELMPPDMRR